MAGESLDMAAVGLMRPQPAKTTPARRLLRFERIGLIEMKPINWAIRDFLELDAVSMVYGKPESGKTFCAYSMGLSMAAGIDWQGRRTKQGPVLVIAGEGRSGGIRRSHAFAIAFGLQLPEVPIYISTTNTALTDPTSAAEFLAVVAEFQHSQGAPVLIIVDTLARNFGPGDENSTRDMSAAVDTCNAIRELTGAAVLIVHHSGHGDDSRGRGSIALRGALDAEYRMEREPDGLIKFECTKMKDAVRPQPLAFRLASVDLGVEDDEGQPVTSAVLRPVDFIPTTPTGKAGKGKLQQIAQRVLRELIETNRGRLLNGGHDPDTARVTLDDWRTGCRQQGISSKRLPEIEASLQTSKQVEVSFGFIAFPEARS